MGHQDCDQGTLVHTPTMAEDISRSGRVRKKSSKLTDYQSSDELDQPKLGKRSHRSSPVHSSLLQSQGSVVEDQPPEHLLAGEASEDDQFDTADNNLDLDLRDEEFDSLPNDDSEDDIVSEAKRSKTEIIKKPLNLPQAKEPKSPVTAFTLWARHTKASLTASSPTMATATLNNKLVNMWTNVPTPEKNNWKRRAQRQGPVVTSVVSGVRPSVTSVRPGPGPLDVAAHLTLLGESLSVIGERLTEHEGQIAVSGSLSVLLDSLLCSLGPLVCLTQHVPELNGANPATLNQILDNVAYIMPGL